MDEVLRQPDPEPDPQPDPLADPPTVEVQREGGRPEVPVTVPVDPTAEADPGPVPEGLVPAEHAEPDGPEVTQELRRPVGRLRRSRHRIALSLEALTGRRRKPRADGRARHRAALNRGQLAMRGVLAAGVLTMVVGGVMPSTETGLPYPVPPASPIVPASPLPTKTPAPAAAPTVKPPPVSPISRSPAPRPSAPPTTTTPPPTTSPSTTTTTPPPTTTTPPPKATTPPPPPPASMTNCPIINEFGDVQPNVRQVACSLDHRFPDVVSLLGRAGRALSTSDHPKGLAADLVVGSQRALGDQIADCAARHFDDWGLSYIIWRQRIKINASAGFTLMEDRGSITANHFDHVHLSFKRGVTPRNLTC